MTAGLLSYWLCPRDYACDDCLLDAILSGRDGGSEATIGDDALHGLGSDPFEHLAVPLRRRQRLAYHPTHFWARSLRPPRVRIGLDDVAARLLEGSQGWQVPRPGRVLAIREEIASTRWEDIPIRLTTPLPGRVLNVNNDLARYPSLLTWSPYDAGWLVDLAVEPDTLDGHGFFHEEGVVARWFQAEVDRLGSCSTRLLTDEDLGPTLADGGLPCATLREALGERGLLAALRAFFPFSGSRS
jgi:glycine cleavage system H protein